VGRRRKRGVVGLKRRKEGIGEAEERRGGTRGGGWKGEKGGERTNIPKSKSPSEVRLPKERIKKGEFQTRTGAVQIRKYHFNA